MILIYLVESAEVMLHVEHNFTKVKSVATFLRRPRENAIKVFKDKIFSFFL
jgi:hypothetical protein